jgi:hypothetical protein
MSKINKENVIWEKEIKKHEEVKLSSVLTV